MPVPTSITDLSKVASDNSPPGTESAKGTIDDYLRAGFAFIRQLADLAGGPTVTLPSSATVNIGFAASLNVAITGTTTITAFDNVAEGTVRWVTFAGALTLTHNAASLQLPGAANIVTAAGDVAMFKSLGGGNWKCMAYQRVSGLPSIAYLPLGGGTMTGQLILKEGTPSSPGLSFANDGAPDTGFYHISDGIFGITCNTVPVVRYGVNQVLQFGIQIQQTEGGNGQQRALFIGRQNNGAERFKWGLNSDERPVLWTYGTDGGFNGAVYFGNGNVNADGAVTGTTVTGTSDERLKKKWRRRPADFLARISNLMVGDFLWKKDSTPGIGTAAQKLEAIWPEAVHTDERGFKSVNYGAAAFVIAVELVRAFFAHVAKTDKRLAKLEGK